MSTAAMVAMVIAVILVLTIVFMAVAGGPRARSVAERQRIAEEVRLSQWRLQQVTNAAMQRLLSEGRQRP